MKQNLKKLPTAERIPYMESCLQRVKSLMSSNNQFNKNLK